MKNIILSILLVTVLLAVSTVPVFADSPDPENVNPNSIVGRIEKFEYISTTKLATIDGISPNAASGCKTYTLGVNGYSPIGAQIWMYAWNIYWCYNGTTITSINKWRTVWTNLGWSFLGDIYATQSGGVGNTSYWHYAQGDFCFIQTWTCVAHSYPWVSQYVYGNGSYTGNAGW